MKVLGLTALLLIHGCGTAKPRDAIEPKPEYEQIYQAFEAEEHERLVTIDRGKDNERSLIVRSRFPNKKSKHGSQDGSSSVAFIDYQFTPHKAGEPYSEILAGASLADHELKAFYFRIGNHAMGQGFKTTEDLLRGTYSQVDSSYISEVEVAQLPMLLVDLGSRRHYFHRIADHRSLQIVMASGVAFSELDPNILLEITSTLESVQVVAIPPGTD